MKRTKAGVREAARAKPCLIRSRSCSLPSKPDPCRLPHPGLLPEREQAGSPTPMTQNNHAATLPGSSLPPPLWPPAPPTRRKPARPARVARLRRPLSAADRHARPQAAGAAPGPGWAADIQSVVAGDGRRQRHQLRHAGRRAGHRRHGHARLYHVTGQGARRQAGRRAGPMRPEHLRPVAEHQPAPPRSWLRWTAPTL